MSALRETVYMLALTIAVGIGVTLSFITVSQHAQIELLRENMKLRQDVLFSAYRYCELSERLTYAYGETLEKIGEQLGVQRSPITTAFFRALKNRPAYTAMGGPEDGGTE